MNGVSAKRRALNRDVCDDSRAMKSYGQQSIRFAAAQLNWLNEATKRAGVSVNAVVRGLVDDAQTYFGLPPTVVEQLEKDRAAMGLDFRRYVQELLTQRYTAVLRAELEADVGSKKRR